MGNKESKERTLSLEQSVSLPWRILLLLRALIETHTIPVAVIEAIFGLYLGWLHGTSAQPAMIPNNSALLGESLATIDPSRWMEQIYGKSPKIKLCDIIIPGTHDSATWKGFTAISKTQSKSIADQLKMGVRYFDLRIGDDYIITHGIENGPALSLLVTLDDFAAFAEEHPSEILFVDCHVIPDTIKELKKLAACLDLKIGKFLVSSTLGSAITFETLWKEQQGKNVILLVRNYFELSSVMENTNLLWDKSLGGNDEFHTNSKNRHWGEVWPDSVSFDVIERKNRIALKNRPPTKWHMSQLIRTPRVRHAVMAVTGFQDGPYSLVTDREKRAGQRSFCSHVGQWLYEWAILAGLPVNFVATDFFEETTLIPHALWINTMKRPSLEL